MTSHDDSSVGEASWLSSARRQLPKPADRIPLSQSGDISGSPIVVGHVRDPRAILEAFHETGANTFLLSVDLHWPTYEQSRAGLKELLRTVSRDEITVLAISYAYPATIAFDAFNEGLEAVPELGAFDVVLAGGVDGATFASRWAAMKRCRSEAVAGCRSAGACFEEPGLAINVAQAKVLSPVLMLHHAGEWRTALAAGFHLADDNVIALGATFPYGKREELLAAGVPEDAILPNRYDYHRYALSWRGCAGTVVGGLAAGGTRELVDALARGPVDEDEALNMQDLADVVLGRARVLVESGPV